MEILDSIGHEVISRLSARYPGIQFELINIYEINDERHIDKGTIYLEYKSSVGNHETICLYTDFSQLSDPDYYEETVAALYNYECELYDSDDDDSYFFD